jgi:hypothetical protein
MKKLLFSLISIISLTGCNSWFDTLPPGETNGNLVEEYKQKKLFSKRAAINQVVTELSIKVPMIFNKTINVELRVNDADVRDNSAFIVFAELIRLGIFAPGGEAKYYLTSKSTPLEDGIALWELTLLDLKSEKTVWSKKIKVKKY